MQLKKHKIIFLVISLSLFLKSQVIKAEVAPRVGGELNLFTKLSSKPTSKQGQVAFVAPSTLLNISSDLEGGDSYFLELQLSANRDNLNHKFQTELNKVFYQWVNTEETQMIRYGLFRNFFHENESAEFNYEFINELNLASRRFSYLSAADIGIEWQYLFNSNLSLGLGVVNGEENRKEEDGNQKDFYLFIDFNDDFFRFAFLYLRGAYDEYEKPFNLKERIMVKWGYNFSFVKLGLEVFSSQDPAVGISDYKRAEGWDSTQFPETIVSGRGGSIWTKWEYGKTTLLLKGDYLDPYLNQNDDEVKSGQFVFGYNLTATRSLYAGYSRTDYGEKHSKYSPEVEFSFAGLRSNF